MRDTDFRWHLRSEVRRTAAFLAAWAVVGALFTGYLALADAPVTAAFVAGFFTACAFCGVVVTADHLLSHWKEARR